MLAVDPRIRGGDNVAVDTVETGGAFWVGSELITIRTAGRETGGAFSLVESVTAPHGGPPLHIHSREDEAFYVIEGQFRFKRDDQELIAGPGMCIFLPKGTMHTYTNIGSGPGKLLVIAIPAGLEMFFAAVGQPGTDLLSPIPPPTEAERARLVTAARQHGIEITGPPLGQA